MNAAQSPAESTARAFGLLWASAQLFHIVSFQLWAVSPTWFAMTLAALLLLARPDSTIRLLTLAVLQLVELVVEYPHVPNHSIIVGLAHIAMLQSFFALARREGVNGVAAGNLIERAAPPVRIVVLLLYFFAVLHKLNVDYFHPGVSCGVNFYEAHRDRFPFLPGGTQSEFFAIYGSLAFEVAIPLLLLFRRTRSLGVIVGVAFHFVLALNPKGVFYNFSSIMTALLFLFDPRPLANALEEVRTRLPDFGGVVRWVLPVAIALVLWLVPVGPKNPTVRLVSLWAWGAFGVAVLSTLIAAYGSERLVRPFRLAAVSLALGPAIAFFNGINPYLGLKTESSFGMFSNLRTEGPRTNHLFIPKSTQLFDFQDDLVIVEGSNHRQLQKMARKGQQVPLFEVEARLTETEKGHGRTGTRSDDPTRELWAEIRRPGDHTSTRLTVADVEIDRVWWLRRWLRFRGVEPGPQSCKH